jgi:hypothetical protein
MNNLNLMTLNPTILDEVTSEGAKVKVTEVTYYHSILSEVTALFPKGPGRVLSLN